VWGLAVVLTWIASQASANEVALSGEQLGCGAARGEFVVFLAPDRGVVVLAAREFPGGTALGSVRDGRLDADLPGYGRLGLTADAPAGTRVWGLLDRTLEIDGRRGCFAFGGFRWSTRDDLLTYVHWGVREVLSRIPYDEAQGESPPAVELGERRVTLELVAPDGKLLRLEGVEGATLGYRPREADVTFFFQPFVVGPSSRRAAVRVSSKRGEFFGPGTTEEIAFVIVGPDEVTTLPTEPAVGLRLSAVQDRVTFVN
jgi:hypothetical protein